MAFASVGALLTDSQKSSSSSWTTSATLTNQLAAGNLGILVVATDNVSTTTGNTNLHLTLADSVGNVWAKLREYTDSGGSAGSGVTVSEWWSVADKTLTTSGTLTLGLASAVTAKVVSGWAFTLAAGKRVAAQAAADRSDNLAGAGSMTLSSLTNIAHLFLRAIGAEGLAFALTATASFTKITDAGTGNTGLTDVQAAGEFRILTGTSGTSAPTTVSTDNQASTFLALDEVIAVDLYDSSASSLFMDAAPNRGVELYDSSVSSLFMDAAPNAKADLFSSGDPYFLDLIVDIQHPSYAITSDSTLAYSPSALQTASYALQSDEVLAYVPAPRASSSYALQLDSILAYSPSAPAATAYALQSDSVLAYAAAAVVTFSVAITSDSTLAYALSAIATSAEACTSTSILAYVPTSVVSTAYALQSDSALTYAATVAVSFACAISSQSVIEYLPVAVGPRPDLLPPSSLFSRRYKVEVRTKPPPGPRPRSFK